MNLEANRRILVIDDNRDIHADFRKLLDPPRHEPDFDDLEAELFGAGPTATALPTYEIHSALQGKDGFQSVVRARDEQRPYALAFVDMRMPPGWDGMTTIDHILSADEEIQIVICTAYSEYSWEDIVRRFPGSDRLLILKKPFDTAEVCQLAAALTEKWHLAKRAHLKRSQLEAMVYEQTSALREINRELTVEVARRTETESALRESQSRFALAAAGARDGVWDWDLRTGKIYFSSRWKTMMGLAEEGGHEAPAVWLDRVEPLDRPILDAALAAHLAGRSEFIQCEYRVAHGEGQSRWMLCRGLATRDTEGKALRVAGSQTDITDRKMAEEQLRVLALHDALTGLPNRLLLQERLERCIARSRRSKEFRYAVLYMDLDRFKVVNDSLGHAAGDALLRGFANRVSGAVRGLDMLVRQTDEPLSRLGGDEFVLVLEDLRNDEDAFRVAERIRDIVGVPFDLDGQRAHVGCSIGIVLGREGYQNHGDLLRDADLALYHAKSQGRDRYVVFDGTIHAATLARWQLEGEMRAALGTGAFQVQYQPIFSLSSGEVESVEALVRWDHPRLGRVPPLDFIPLAEETGLIVPLGLEVFRTVCRDLRRWREEHPALKHLRAAVNVSPRQLERGELSAVFAEVLAAEGIEGSAFDIEITESVLMDAGPARRVELENLRALGFRLHLDDFGTGYCSLGYLRDIRVDALKIDRSFVQAMGTDPMTEPIVRAILTLAHTFQIGVVAEGIETGEQRDRMLRLGCDLGQGYYFARPSDAERIPAILLDCQKG